jgi:hypothetical protein
MHAWGAKAGGAPVVMVDIRGRRPYTRTSAWAAAHAAIVAADMHLCARHWQAYMCDWQRHTLARHCSSTRSPCITIMQGRKLKLLCAMHTCSFMHHIAQLATQGHVWRDRRASNKRSSTCKSMHIHICMLCMARTVTARSLRAPTLAPRVVRSFALACVSTGRPLACCAHAVQRPHRGHVGRCQGNVTVVFVA